VPGGFGIRGIEGKVEAVEYARTRGIPFLGICLGMQCAVIETARNLAGLADASSSEFSPEGPHPVIDLMEQQRGITRMGATMRLGAYPCLITPGSLAELAYGSLEISERHRHRYEVNNTYRDVLAGAGMACTGLSPDGSLVEIVERPDHPWFVACQFHPEFKSRPLDPGPLFVGFVAAAERYADV
jgi:CTP synthase